MSLNVILVRHAETVWHAENRYAGRSDIPLTGHGRDQARGLAGWAAEAGLSAVWASPMARSRETARDSAERAGLPLGVDPRLRELDFGIAEGLTRDEMKERFPGRLSAFQDDPVAHHFPEGEHPVRAGDRMVDFLTGLRAEHGDRGRVLVVGHSTVIRLTMCRLLGLPPADYRRTFPLLANCALNEFALRDDGRAALLTLNRPVT